MIFSKEIEERRKIFLEEEKPTQESIFQEKFKLGRRYKVTRKDPYALLKEPPDLMENWPDHEELVTEKTLKTGEIFKFLGFKTVEVPIKEKLYFCTYMKIQFNDIDAWIRIFDDEALPEPILSRYSLDLYFDIFDGKRRI